MKQKEITKTIATSTKPKNSLIGLYLLVRKVNETPVVQSKNVQFPAA